MKQSEYETHQHWMAWCDQIPLAWGMVNHSFRFRYHTQLPTIVWKQECKYTRNGGFLGSASTRFSAMVHSTSSSWTTTSFFKIFTANTSFVILCSARTTCKEDVKYEVSLMHYLVQWETKHSSKRHVPFQNYPFLIRSKSWNRSLEPRRVVDDWLLYWLELRTASFLWNTASPGKRLFQPLFSGQIPCLSIRPIINPRRGAEEPKVMPPHAYIKPSLLWISFSYPPHRLLP